MNRRPRPISLRVPLAPRAPRAGFTLLELLAVLAVIGILAALIFPSIGAARRSAHRARTKVQFNQWAAAIESFRGEYGYYPTFDPTNLVNGGASGAAAAEHRFHDVLAGRRRNGDLPTVAGAESAAAQNRRLIRFHTFSEGEFTPADGAAPHLLRDAFDQTSLAVLVDRNLDGAIHLGGVAGDYAGLPAVVAGDGSTIRPTSGAGTADFPPDGVRAGVVFYGPAPGATAANPEFIFSWK